MKPLPLVIVLLAAAAHPSAFATEPLPISLPTARIAPTTLDEVVIRLPTEQQASAGRAAAAATGSREHPGATLDEQVMEHARNRTTDPRTLALMLPGNVIHDTAREVRAVYPAGWNVRLAFPTESGATSVRLHFPRSKATLTFHYRTNYPQPEASSEVEALLRRQAAEKETDRRIHAPEYANRTSSMVYAPANGQPALRWFADYPRPGKPWSEYLVRIVGQNSVAQLLLNGPADEIAALRPAVDTMADTVELP